MTKPLYERWRGLVFSCRYTITDILTKLEGAQGDKGHIYSGFWQKRL